ncbi:MAG: M1 family metallopeptidase [Gemmatimonadetes bacterium]|nr:M1 family metallopeptidase [Gemmatimonadota bacterium]MBK7786165.1 M1 family metallopeptidase [Gemmatimonadota bacterium]MBK9065551.1 M1 family metallopeptidase [Gemmatimonadota bacterium]
MIIATLFLAAVQLPAAAPHAPYWQQGVRYEIRARLDEASGVLGGQQQVTYINRSPDTLTTFAFHLHLNAFRPGSRWADADSVERRRRFNDLTDPDFAFAHVRNVRMMGQAVTPVFPFAPDSTIARFTLPRPLAPGDSMVVDLDFDARPSTTPRRQGRRGRAFDFAQSYPKVVVYDRHGWNEQPLYPGGEFYGEFATYLVELDLARDQVIGATGVPICGDPGWESANQVPDRPIQYQRDHYPNAPRYTAVGTECVRAVDGPPRDVALVMGRKRVVWYAEDVHHWAASLNPAYKYEGAAFGPVAVHVLYQPGDTASWGRGVATQRTVKALQWLDHIFGPFAWPQITNVHRIEGGGTEFPMMIMDGSAGQGLIVHELGHNYTMGILANNEWREGWLDEGFTSFQTSLFSATQQGGTDEDPADDAFLTGLDLDGMSEPASLVSDKYRDFTSYGISIYSRGEMFFHRLRYVVGDAAMLRILRTFYDRWKLKHVDEAAFRAVAEEVSGMDLGTFFGQGLHGTELVDYAVGRVKIEASSPGAAGASGWETRVEVLRKADGRIPVEVWVFGASDTAMVRTDGLAAAEWVTVQTRSKPREVRLDPRVRTGDWNMLNNTWRKGFLGIVTREPKRERYLDTGFSQRTARDRRAEGTMPVAWYNDAAGITLGLRTREDYFGRFEQNLSMFSYGTGWESDRDVKDSDFLIRMRNPTALRAPGLSQTLEGYNVEGRYGARLAVEQTRRPHLSFGPTHTMGASLTWHVPDDARYLEPGYYDDAGTVELGLAAGVTDQVNGWNLASRFGVAGGLAYNPDGLAAATGRTDLDPVYGRGTLELEARRALGAAAPGRPARWSFGFRLFGGVSTSGASAVKQRQVYVAGADPLERFGNPFLRSDGALLVRPDVNYHAPGGGNLRGFDPRLSADGLVAVNLELERTVLLRRGGHLFNRVGIALFGDAGHTFDDRAADRLLADAGIGLRIDHRIGQTRFTTRVDLPLLVNRPALAQDTHPGSDKAGFRWTFSFTPAF